MMGRLHRNYFAFGEFKLTKAPEEFLKRSTGLDLHLKL